MEAIWIIKIISADYTRRNETCWPLPAAASLHRTLSTRKVFGASRTDAIRATAATTCSPSTTERLSLLIDWRNLIMARTAVCERSLAMGNDLERDLPIRDLRAVLVRDPQVSSPRSAYFPSSVSPYSCSTDLMLYSSQTPAPQGCDYRSGRRSPGLPGRDGTSSETHRDRA